MPSNSYHKTRSNTNEYDPWVFKISNKESFRLFTCFSSYSKFLLCTISSSFKLVSLRWKVFYGTWDKNSKKYNKVEFEGMNVLAKGGQIWSSISIFIFPIYVYNNSRPLLIYSKHYLFSLCCIVHSNYIQDVWKKIRYFLENKKSIFLFWILVAMAHFGWRKIFHTADKKRKVSLKLWNRPTQNVELRWGHVWDYNFAGKFNRNPLLTTAHKNEMVHLA